MGPVMPDAMDLRPERAGPDAHACSQGGPEVAHLEGVPHAIGDGAEAGSIGEREAQLTREMSSRIAIHGDRVHPIEWNVSGAETKANRFQRQARPVLDSEEPFLLRGRHQRAVHDDASTRLR